MKIWSVGGKLSLLLLSCIITCVWSQPIQDWTQGLTCIIRAFWKGNWCQLVPASISSKKLAAFIWSTLCLLEAWCLKEIPGDCNHHEWVITAFVGVAELSITLLVLNPLNCFCVCKFEMHLAALVFSCIKEFEMEDTTRCFAWLRNWIGIFTCSMRYYEVTTGFFFRLIIIVSKWSLFVNIWVVLLKNWNANEVMRGEELVHPEQCLLDQIFPAALCSNLKDFKCNFGISFLVEEKCCLGMTLSNVPCSMGHS